MLGFTRNEQRVLLFLTACFVTGGSIKIYQEHYQPLPNAPDESIILESTDSGFVAVSISQEKKIETGSFFNVQLNTAGQIELERIPGIGPVMARRILSYRQSKGRFQTVDELLNVKGIGPKKLQKIRSYVQIQ
jgi:comEA protein